MMTTSYSDLVTMIETDSSLFGRAIERLSEDYSVILGCFRCVAK